MRKLLFVISLLCYIPAIGQTRRCIFSNLDMQKFQLINNVAIAIEDNDIKKVQQYLSSNHKILLAVLQKDMIYVSEKLVPGLQKSSLGIIDKQTKSPLYLEQVYYKKEGEKLAYLYAIKIVCNQQYKVTDIQFIKPSAIVKRDKEILDRERSALASPPPPLPSFLKP